MRIIIKGGLQSTVACIFYLFTS